MRRLLALLLLFSVPAFGDQISSSSNVVPLSTSGDVVCTGATAAGICAGTLTNMGGLLPIGAFQMPETAQTGNYTLLSSDNGKNITATGSAAQTFKLVSNSLVTPLAAGYIVAITNASTGTTTATSVLDIQTQGSNTLNGLTDIFLLPGETALIWTDTVNYQALVGKMPYNLPNVQTGTTYTALASDCANTVTLNNASAVTVTLPSTLPLGCGIGWVQIGAGQVAFSAGSGATLNNRSSQSHIAGRYGAATTYIYANSGGSAATYTLAGDTN